MAHDPALTKRNLLVIPGGLLAFYGLLAMLYAQLMRAATATACPDASYVLVRGVCYSVMKLAAIPVALGLLMVLIGALAFRRRARSIEGCLYPGTGVHFTLALLTSWVSLTLLGVLVFGVRQGIEDVLYTIDVLGTEYQLVFILELLFAAALLAYVPFLGLLLHHGRMRRRLFAILDEEDGTVEPAAGNSPHARMRAAPLRDVSGSEGAYVSLDDEKKDD